MTSVLWLSWTSGAKEGTWSVVVKEPHAIFISSDACLGAHAGLGSAYTISFLMQGCRDIFIL